ncbi:MAG: UDP-glucose 4-epimerase GalE [Propionibacteriaceae bacterium]|nr:UDP-glucose 4-epimerase GalE [Propionibacteriaceae bacterium]
MTVLVTGGAGYIGAHIVEALAGRPVVIVDDLSTGSVDRIPGADVVVTDVAASGAPALLGALMRERQVDAVIHLAARKRVDESVARPLFYYRQNVDGLRHVLEAMVQAGTRRLVFSSSAAVYGETGAAQVRESDPTTPVNPYGRTKLIGEWLCRDLVTAGLLDVVALRYFNVAGAGRADLGDPAVMNLATMVIDRLLRGESPMIFGDDYPTPDGTCVRDFVHVVDLADAHRAALDALSNGTLSGFEVLNVGTGRGASVRQVVEQLITLSGQALAPVLASRRPGDPAAVVACADRIGQRLGWKARSGLTEILTSAWQAALATRVVA